MFWTTGNGTLHPTTHKFNIKIIKALKKLQIAIARIYTNTKIHVYINSISVIWCLRANISDFF